MSDLNIMHYDTVRLNEAGDALIIIDQTLLPNEVVYLELRNQDAIWEAIKRLRVRGAPAIGVAAGIGLYLASLDIEEEDPDHFIEAFKAARDYLASSRPTAVNLFWALDRIYKTAEEHKQLSLADRRARLKQEAIAIHDEDIAMSKAIGEYGLTLIQDGDGVLTHCNAGQLATTKYGTALAPLHLGREKGMQFKVFTDETRPLLQGARLSAFECVSDGLDTTLICDNMASQVMKNGWVNAVFVGADRITANGDACNKIGTSGVAILAKHYGIPFYVLAPTSTIDMSLESGKQIPIEIREDEEVTTAWYKEPMAPKGVKVYNPAFDVTDHELITAIISEKGIARAPFTESLKAWFDEK